MKIAFFGTPQFAAEILRGILESPHPQPLYPRVLSLQLPAEFTLSQGARGVEVVLVVSQPDKPIGRRQELQVTPVKQVALEYDIPLLQPEKLSPSLKSLPKGETKLQEILKSLHLDFIVVVAYGKIIPKEILTIPKYGCINIHGSILPKYRGASPVQSAIKNGESETGLTIMYMDEKMDEGDILQIQKISIDSDDTSPDIFEKFVEIGPKVLVDTLEKVFL